MFEDKYYTVNWTCAHCGRKWQKKIKRLESTAKDFGDTIENYTLTACEECMEDYAKKKQKNAH